MSIELYNEDCMVRMKKMDSESIDLTITSPPYDNLRDYKGYTFNFEGIANELFRITKDGGVVVWVVGDATIDGSETCTSDRQKLYFKDICGFKVHDTMIYKSGKPPLTHNRYEQEFEYMFVFCKGKLNTFNPIKVKTNFCGDIKKYYYGPASSQEKSRATRQREGQTIVNEYKFRGNIWEYATGMNGSTADKIAFQHPAIFPEKLAQDHILSWSNKDDMVFDPMMGSGTVGKMAKILGRQFIGMEISEEYFKIAEQRIKNTTPPLF